MTHDAVYRWDEPIQRGIREMGLILMELISLRLTYPPIPVYLLQLLSMVSSDVIAQFYKRAPLPFLS